MADENKLPYNNRAHAVGILETFEMKTGEKNDRSFKFLQGEIKVGDDKVRFSVWGTRKRPTLPDEYYAKFSKGKAVSVTGTLEEQVNDEQRLYRGIRAWGMDEAVVGEEMRLVYHVAGHLGDLEKTGDGEYVVPLTIVRQVTNDKQETTDKEDTVRVHPTREQLEAIFKTHKIIKGTLVRARGDIINRGEVDRYGVIQGFKSQLTVAFLEKYDEQAKVWSKVPGTDAPAPTGAAPTAPPQPPREAPAATGAAPAAAPPAAAPQRAGLPKAQQDDDVPF